MKGNSGSVSLVILAVFVLVIISFFGFYAWQKSESSNKITPVVVQKPVVETKPKDKLDVVSDEWKSSFVSDIYPKYTFLAKLFTTDKINRVFPIQVEQTNNVKGGGYLVEVSNERPEVFTYFLVTPLVQKELVNATGSYYKNAYTSCQITQYITTGNERNLGRKLLDRMGYLVLGGECHSYGGGSFVSAYHISDATQILFEGNFTLPWLQGSPSGTSNGNIFGNLVGVYGITKPVVIVNFGSSSPANEVEGLYMTAYFDLQTGSLIQKIKFQ